MESNTVVIATTALHGTDWTTLIFQTNNSVARTQTKGHTKPFTKNASARTDLESTNTKTSRINNFCIKVDKLYI